MINAKTAYAIRPFRRASRFAIGAAKFARRAGLGPAIGGCAKKRDFVGFLTLAGGSTIAAEGAPF